MKNTRRPSLLLSLILIASFVSSAQTIPIDSLYLGQTPPGDTPKIFIPHSHARLAISNDGKTIYYCSTAADGSNYTNIYYYKYFNNKWNGPFKLFDGFIAPTLSKNEDTLYTMTYAYQSYFSLKKDSVWSTPSLISKNVLYYLEETSLGNFYCSSDISEGSIGTWDLYKLAFNNADITLQNLGRPLNTCNNDGEFYIAKDESFIVLGANVDLHNYNRDLYISYRKSDSTWTSPKSLGTSINDGMSHKWGSFVTADNKYLFYSRDVNNDFSTVCLYWVRFDRLLDSLKYTNFPPYAKSSIPNQNTIKGVPFSFTIPDSIFFDEDNDSLTYSAMLSNGNPLPDWLSFNPLTRTFAGTPPTTSVRNISITIRVIATDKALASGSFVFTLWAMNPNDVEENIQLPKETQLLQNYPNPFNPTTVINYRLPASSNVKLTVYNLLGQKIKILANSFQSVGEHSIVWDATDERNKPVSSGVYFYKLEADNITFQKKMLLVR